VKPGSFLLKSPLGDHCCGSECEHAHAAFGCRSASSGLPHYSAVDFSRLRSARVIAACSRQNSVLQSGEYYSSRQCHILLHRHLISHSDSVTHLPRCGRAHRMHGRPSSFYRCRGVRDRSSSAAGEPKKKENEQRRKSCTRDADAPIGAASLDEALA